MKHQGQSSNPESWIATGLDELRNTHLERSLTVYPEAGGIVRDIGHRYINLSSNDYLNLTHHPDVIEGARHELESYGTGATASRLVTGTLPVHEELEAALAALKGYPAALLFGSGYLANTGILPALVGPEDTVFADRLVHASLIDGIRLSRARLKRFHHNDATHLAELLGKHDGTGRRLVVTESVFSMDGDLAPLADIARLSEDHGALFLVDEAHAMGVFGPGGAGRVREAGLEQRVNVCVGTLSKGLGNYGGFAACSNDLRQWLINRARTFIYSTALPPSVVGSTLAALTVLGEDPTRGPSLLARAARLRNRLQEENLDTLQSASQIIPIVVGESERALRASRALLDAGLVATAIRPPTVPRGTARLRLSITSAHTEEDLEHAAQTIIRTLRNV